MKESSIRGLGLQAAAVLALAGSGSAHSWIETAYRVASNGTMIGSPGYPRGYVPRNSTDPVYSDTIPVWLLPSPGQSAYSGDEILNKFPKQDRPEHPMLEASAGDYISLTHLENGHTTLPQNQPLKPRNRGTIFLYGTSEPRDQERLFDVHLVWNRDGTGGDGRGRLLGTRSYDDGQCYQPNDGALSVQRAAALRADGASHDQELPCQSDLRLPGDLEPGSVYTIYWYWDWPDLNAAAMGVEATADGIYPWAGSFMRDGAGAVDAHGFSMAAISKNESYASTIDIRITGRGSSSSSSSLYNSKHAVAKDYVDEQNVYSKAIKQQLEDNYQVDIDAAAGLGTSSSSSSTETSTSTSSGTTATVTAFTTVWPSTTWTTITRTASTFSAPPSPSSSLLSSSAGDFGLLDHIPVALLPTAVPTVVESMTPHAPSLPNRVVAVKAGYLAH